MKLLWILFGLGKPSLQYLTLREHWKLDKVTRRAAEGLDMSSPSSPFVRQEYARRAIPLMERAVQDQPNEWLYWYKLADFYCEVKEYSKAVRACERAMKLRPTDPRSCYALATTLRLLTHAKYTPSEAQSIRMQLPYIPIPRDTPRLTPDFFDPVASSRALQELGLTVDSAAEQAFRLFEKTLALGVRSDDIESVEFSLSVISTEFPHLSKDA